MSEPQLQQAAPLAQQSEHEGESMQMRSMSPPQMNLASGSADAGGDPPSGDVIQAQSVGNITQPLQRQADPYADYKGDPVNKEGRVSAPGDQLSIAKSQGVILREKPDGSLPAQGHVRYNSQVQVVCHDNTKQFYYVVPMGAGRPGWINNAFVAMDAPDFNAELHNIQEGNLTTLLKNYYVDTGKWSLGSGNDYTTLAAAVQVANQGRAGVTIDWAKVQQYKDDNKLKAFADPWMLDNFAIYSGSDIKQGMNIWMPSVAYIQTLQASGAIGSRPEWLNTAVDVGKGIAGFTSGVVSGVFEGLWEMVEGLWEIGKGIVNTVKSVLDGSLFTGLASFYETIKNMDASKMMAMVQEIITMGQAAWGNFVASWNAPNSFDRWHFRGRIVGQIVLEVVLAIFTGGGSLGAKVLAKIGAKFPKLARMLNGLLDAADRITPGNRRNRNRNDRDNDRDKDNENLEGNDRAWEQTRAMAAMVTEGHDLKDTPVTELVAHLNAQFAAPSRVVKGYKAQPNGDGSYKVMQLKRKDTVDKHYTDSNERRDANDHEDAGGHTIERHVGKSDNWLRNRLRNNPNMEAASTFNNIQAANKAQGRFVKKHKDDIAQWLRSGEQRLVKEFDAGEMVGRVIEQGKHNPFDTSRVRVVIDLDPGSPQGWKFVTSFPIP